MDVTLIPTLNKKTKFDVLVLPFFIKGKSVKPAFKEKEWLAIGKLPIELGDFKGSEGETFLLYSQEVRCLLLGLGVLEKITSESLRRAAASLTKFCQQKKWSQVALYLPKTAMTEKKTLEGFLEGLTLANYVFDQLKKEKASPVKKVTLLGASKECQKILDHTLAVVEGVNLARDLVNGSPDDVTPDSLAQVALSFEKKFKNIKVTVLDKAAIQSMGMGLLLAVSQGSEVEPKFIIVQYKPSSSGDHTVLIGKGVTYDSGGLMLKTAEGLLKQKADMGGAACVLGTLFAAAKLSLKVNITALIPASENGIDGKSYKPGAVYKSYLGKTVEITNTDAEGRLLLAEALAYADKNLAPSRLIDFATLTGGVMVALGDRISGLMGNDPNLKKALLKASGRTQEEIWELPLCKDYKQYLSSEIADLKNAADHRYAHAIVAGLFLEEFVGQVPWAHLDIAGTAFINQPRSYSPTKATGVGVRLMIAFLEDLLASQES